MPDARLRFAPAVAPFPGSYGPDDVDFLLRRVRLDPTPAEEQQRLIESGARSIFEMVTPEPPPDAATLALFDAALARNATRLAADAAALARAVADQPGREIAICSLVRAGVPFGILTARALRRLGRPCRHYAVSLVREVGLDAAALDHVLARHDPASIAWVDGWTGKGATARGLAAGAAAYAARRGVTLDATLRTVQDIAGIAASAASSDDYLIPSAMLNAVVSGLVSRTIIPAGHGPDDPHACVFYEDLLAHDRSRAFVDAIDAAAPPPGAVRAAGGPDGDARERAAAFVATMAARFGLADHDRIKPGLNEATRAIILRVPDRVLVRDPGDPDAAHILRAAAAKGVPVELDPRLPYRATVITKPLKAAL